MSGLNRANLERFSEATREEPNRRHANEIQPCNKIPRPRRRNTLMLFRDRMKATWFLVVLGVGLNACGDDVVCPEAGGSQKAPTGSVCNGSTLTYENFGRQFMETYCTECHSSSLEGDEARQCAPSGGHNYETLAAIVDDFDHVDEYAAAGPSSVNNAMPPKGFPTPTEQERRNLGTWLACELERMPQ
jgi:hypothetical protein